MQDQRNHAANQDRVTALLDSAEALINSNQYDEADGNVKEALALIPADARGFALKTRIDSNREMELRKIEASATKALESAEKLVASDLPAAIKAFGGIIANPSFPSEVKQKAAERSGFLKGAVCCLKLPDDWPAGAVLFIDDEERKTEPRLVTGITPGKHKIRFERYQYRAPAPIELDFRTLDPVPLPEVRWRMWGTTVTVQSKPAGARIWRNGKDTGKTTPAKIEDVDDGEIGITLKMAGHADTPVKGLVKDRKPLNLSANMLELPKLPSEGKSAGERREFNLTANCRVPFRWCPPGSFKMGGNAPGEKPIHEVKLTKGFWLAETEFTQKQWEEIAGEFAEVIFLFEGKGKPKPAVGPNLPMVFASWEKICGDSSRKGGLLGKINAWFGSNKNPWVADLPTEAQWEYACLSGIKGDFGGKSSDSKAADVLAWHGGNSGGTAHDVATKAANSWGFHDMHGNVYEWCRDWHQENYQKSPVTDPTGPVLGEWNKTIRGGCFSSPAAACRSSARSGADRFKGHGIIGFRLALHLPEAAPKPAPKPTKKAPAKPKPKPKPKPAKKKGK